MQSTIEKYCTLCIALLYICLLCNIVFKCMCNIVQVQHVNKVQHISNKMSSSNALCNRNLGTEGQHSFLHKGNDRSARNRHWHCIECHHPFHTPAKLKNHMLHKHSDVYAENELKHLDKCKYLLLLTCSCEFRHFKILSLVVKICIQVVLKPAFSSFHFSPLNSRQHSTKRGLTQMAL